MGWSGQSSYRKLLKNILDKMMKYIVLRRLDEKVKIRESSDCFILSAGLLQIDGVGL